MTDERDADSNLLPDEKRLTGIGKFIRSTLLDEILQLINVFKGDMALIGPYQLLVQYLPVYNETQRRRHEVSSSRHYRLGAGEREECHIVGTEI